MKIHREVRRCTTALVIAVSIGLSAAAFAGGEDIVASQATPEMAGGLIVKYRAEQKGAALSERVSLMQGASGKRGVAARYFRSGALGTHVMKLDRKLPIQEVEALASEIKAADPNIEYVEPDRLMHAMFVPNDPRYNEQWHYFESVGGLNLPAAWDQSTGAGVVVAVIDTGYRPHADLTANLLSGYDFISDAARANDGGGRDSDALDPGDSCNGAASTWHGTHVAGTIAAQTNNGVGVAGVAFNAKVLPVRVLGVCDGTVSDIADAIVWASGGSVSGVPANPNPARVLNLSLGGGGTCSATYQNAINSARSRNSVVVVAAGNSAANAANFQPASCSGVITVAAINRAGSRAWYSNFGISVEISAPGGDTSFVANDGVLSTLNTGFSSPGADDFRFYQGTSMATPHVAGVVALMLSKNPSLTPDQVLTYLQGTARSFPGTCSECGLGIVNAAAAVSLTPAPGVTPSAPTNIRSNPPQYSILGGYRILWDATANVTTYQLERDQDTGFTAPNYLLSTVTAPATSQAFTEPRVLRIFYFRVRGCNGSLCGPWSEVISREVDCSSNCP